MKKYPSIFDRLVKLVLCGLLLTAMPCMALAQVDAIHALPNTVLHITDRSGDSMDGIVCDNLHSTTFVDANELRITLDAVYAQANVTGDVYDADGVAQTDRQGHPNAGHLDGSIGSCSYFPPDEFNFEQTPLTASTSDLTRESTRTVILKLHFTMPDGTRYDVADQSVILARPPVVLIHGVNTSPAYWKPFIASVSSVLQTPIVAVNHRDPKDYKGIDYRRVPTGLFRGNGPVEVGADLLEQRIQETLSQVRAGQSITDADQNSGEEINQYNAYVGKKLAIRRVDVIGWSYGGMIARWYTSPKQAEALQSATWYKRPGGYTLPNPTGGQIDFTKNLPIVTYNGDIRKIITLGTMWRGVPLVNYLNEALFPPVGNTRLSEAPIGALYTTQYRNVGAVIDSLPMLTRVPAMESMAVNSPWLSYLDKTNLPFVSEIAYGSVAGDHNGYLAIPAVGQTVDPYSAIDLLQKPSWFPYLTLERKLFTERNYTDGLVPIWSAAIPGSHIIAPVIHSQLPNDPSTVRYILQSLNSSALPTGTTLNPLWNTSIKTFDQSRTWNFTPGMMAPEIQNDLYVQVNGVGRIATGALQPNHIGLSSIADQDTLNQIGEAAVANAQKASEAVKGAVTKGGQILAPLGNLLPSWMKP